MIKDNIKVETYRKESNMNEFGHEEYIREVPGASCAVVFIHGILSTPLFFEKLIEKVPEDFSVYNILLDGHGGMVKDFSESSMKIWKHQARYLINTLSKKYESIILVGHSMGTLFSIQNAVKYPQKIKALFLICSPLKVRVHPRSAKYSLRIIFERPSKEDPIEDSARKWYSIKPDKKLWRYIPWIPKFTCLLSEIRKTRKLTHEISMPTLVFHADNDSLVSKKAVKFFHHNSNVQVTHLKTSFHQYFSNADYELMLDSFSELIKTINKKP